MNYNSAAVDDLIKSINTLLKVRVRMSSMLTSSRIARSNFLKKNSEARKWRSINEDIARNRRNVTNRVSELYNSNAQDKIWIRAAARINESLKMVLGNQAESVNHQALGDVNLLDNVVGSLINKNVQLIKTFYKSIYSLELERKTLTRRSSLRRSSRMNYDQCRDLLKILEALIQSNKHVGKSNPLDMMSNLDDLQMEFDLPLEDNLRNLSDNMFERNKLIKNTINTYAYEYWCRRKSIENQLSSESSVSSGQLQSVKLEEQEEEMNEKELSLLDQLSELKEDDYEGLEPLHFINKYGSSFNEEKKLTNGSEQSLSDRPQFTLPTVSAISPFLLSRYNNETPSRKLKIIKRQEISQCDIIVKTLTLNRDQKRSVQQPIYIPIPNETPKAKTKIIKSSHSVRKLSIINKNLVDSSFSLKKYNQASASERISHNHQSPPSEPNHFFWNNTSGYIRKSSRVNLKKLGPHRYQRKQKLSHDQAEIENLRIILTQKSNLHLTLKQPAKFHRQNYMEFTRQRQTRATDRPR